MYTVYILQSAVRQRYYIGHTKNINIRLHAHNTGKVRSTKPYRPWKVVYTERIQTKQEAYVHEMQIKSYKGGNAFKKTYKLYLKR